MKAFSSEARDRAAPFTRVAVLLDSAFCSPPEYQLIQSLDADSSAEITVISGFKHKHSLYSVFLRLNMLVLSLFIGRLRAFRRRKRIDFVDVHPPSAAPLQDSETNRFDLVLDLRGGYLQPNPPSAYHLSIRFGDISTHTSGPAGFWEMISDAGASGIFLMKGTSCLFSGRYKTKRLLALNVASVYREGLHDIGTLLKRAIRTGVLPGPTDTPHPPATFSPPRIRHMVHYWLLTLMREAVCCLRTTIVRQSQRFSVELLQGPWQALASETDRPRSQPIPNPDGHYYADPIVIEHEGQTVCFVEDFEYGRDKGRIVAFDLTSGSLGSPVPLGVVIDEAFHLSFPFVFRYEGALYMIPETFEDNRISVYRCTDFPLQWERHQTLMDNVQASDSMLFEHDNRWWMLTNMRPEGCRDFYARLYAFYSDSPLSTEWTPHDLNPILVDADGGRNAGMLRDEHGQLHRVGQHQGMHIYGKSCSVRRIVDLSPSAYREEGVLHLTPDVAASVSGSPALIGTHHIDASASWTAFDTLRWERP